MAQKDPRAISYRPELYKAFGDVSKQNGYYGEFSGYVYNPYTQSYDRDPKVAEQLANDLGYGEKKPSAMDTYGPAVAGTVGSAAAYAGSQYLAGLAGAGGASAAGGAGAGAAAGAGAGAATTTGATGAASAAASQAAAATAAEAAGTTAATTTATTTGTTTGAGAGGGAASGALTGAAVIGTIAGLYGSWENYKKFKKESKGGDFTDQEINKMTHSDYLDMEKYLEYMPWIEPFVKGGKWGTRQVLKPFIGSTKHEEQIWRDRMRKGLEEKGFAQKNENGSHVVTLADGSQFDIGVDGIKQGQMGEAYNVDLNDPMARKMAGQLKPLAFALAGDTTRDPKRREKIVSDMTGYLTNAALSNGDAEANLRAMYAQAGITDKQTGYDILAKIKDAGALDDQTYTQYQDALNQIYDENYDYGDKPWYEQQVELPSYAIPAKGGLVGLGEQPQQPAQPQQAGLPSSSPGLLGVGQKPVVGQPVQPMVGLSNYKPGSDPAVDAALETLKKNGVLQYGA